MEARLGPRRNCRIFVQNGWKAVSTGGTVFDDVDLRDDWADFCEKMAESVGVYAIEGRFRRI